MADGHGAWADCWVRGLGGLQSQAYRTRSPWFQFLVHQSPRLTPAAWLVFTLSHSEIFQSQGRNSRTPQGSRQMLCGACLSQRPARYPVLRGQTAQELDSGPQPATVRLGPTAWSSGGKRREQHVHRACGQKSGFTGLRRVSTASPLSRPTAG